MTIEAIAIVSGLIFGAGLIIAKVVIGRALAKRAGDGPSRNGA